MSLFRRYSQAGGAIHDLEHLAGLSADRTIPLLVSPKVLYLLQNFAGQDVAFECRWAVERQERGYLRLTSDDAEYPDFLELVHDVGVQTSERAAGMGTLLNYREAQFVQTGENNASAGSNFLTIQGPGADEAWILEHVTLTNVTSSGVSAALYIVSGSNVQQVCPLTNITPSTSLIVSGPISLSEDFAIQAGFFNCQAGDDLVFQATGYIMDRPA